MAECSAEGCHRPAHARGVCSSHYHAVRAALSDDEKRTRVDPNASIEERIDAHTHWEGDKLLWDGFLSKGVPALSITEDGKRRLVYVRQEQLRRSGRPKPPGRWFARVTSGDERDVNPDHLKWDNRRAGVAVTAEAAKQLIQTHQRGEVNLSDLADAMGVSRQAIYKAMKAQGYEFSESAGS